MSKTTCKRYSGAFEAKAGLEALMGAKTVGQFGRKNQVHTVQVMQWKGIIRDYLPELFESRWCLKFKMRSPGALNSSTLSWQNKIH